MFCVQFINVDDDDDDDVDAVGTQEYSVLSTQCLEQRQSAEAEVGDNGRGVDCGLVGGACFSMAPLHFPFSLLHSFRPSTLGVWCVLCVDAGNFS